MPYELVVKPTFNNQLRVIPPKFMAQILEKVNLLCDDPSPREPVKKKLHGTKGDLYRLRSGGFRIIYTYGNGMVTLLGVDDRKDVYKRDLLQVDLPSIAAEDIPSVADLLTPVDMPAAYTWQHVHPTQVAAEPLPQPIDLEMLEQLRIPAAFHQILLACKTADDLCAADVPGTIRDAVFDVATTPDYDQVLAHQPSYIVPTVDDLLRYREGELMGFLLRLSPAQERYVTWGLNASGPTLVKGGPGTGKSTIALYRVRELLDTLREAGVEQPRILFTTYTNALVAYSRQLLYSLLGNDVDFVDVRTADNLCWSIWKARYGDPPQPASPQEMHRALSHAKSSATFEGNALQQAAQQQTIDRMDADYLLEEIHSIIMARQIPTLEAYLEVARTGRKVGLNATQQAAVWTVYEGYVRELAAMKRLTFQQLRAEAEVLVRAGEGPQPYDAVVVDEAQDLDPSALRLLIGLCRAPNRFFVTADANQSIYGSGFTWEDVHADLKFRGRTGVLRTNFRSTRDIAEAAHAYLSGGELDVEGLTEREYVHDGPQPAVRRSATGAAECDLLARFLPAAARMFHLGRASCAVLVPTAEAGRSIAAELTSRGVKAAFMASNELDLASLDVKVLTLKAAKGLEFPVVTLAGFVQTQYPKRTTTMSDGEWDEMLARERRTMFVGMTRAMRALLVSASTMSSPLFTGFSPEYWNCDTAQ